MSTSSGKSSLLFQQTILGFVTVFWLNRICLIVPEPYLDEVFHIGQAQAYLNNKWDIWDPKITTPAGLYLVSYVQSLLLKPLGFHDVSSPTVLRSLNAVFGCVLLPVLVRQLLFLITRKAEAAEDGRDPNFSHSVLEERLGHAALNICLFPPLFFFYGLYYTDVLSACSVLYAYHCHLRKEYVNVIFAGLASLFFRQTNIFWVAVFLGGLELVRTLPTGRPNIEFPRRATYHDVVLGSWKHACVYDRFVDEASFEDYIKTIISLAIVATVSLFTKSSTMFWNLSSYILVMLAFIEFIVWNGGVVLGKYLPISHILAPTLLTDKHAGDKENHIASLHLAQLLYIWPYFFFFSFPLLGPYLLNALIPQNYLPRVFQTGSLQPRLPRIIIAIPVLAAMLAIVHYNTIVHPFTLADNRHYMFYVFRLLLRHPLIKYLAVPVYFASALSCFTALGTSISSSKSSSSLRKTHTRTTFTIVWLLSTTLSLCSAPLVEPRYLILPWLLWRIHIVVARPRTSGRTKEHSKSRKDEKGEEQLPLELWLETAWFLLVNAVTGYVFLYRGFEWPLAPGLEGTVRPVQRFMW